MDLAAILSRVCAGGSILVEKSWAGSGTMDLHQPIEQDLTLITLMEIRRVGKNQKLCWWNSFNGVLGMFVTTGVPSFFIIKMYHLSGRVVLSLIAVSVMLLSPFLKGNATLKRIYDSLWIKPVDKTLQTWWYEMVVQPIPRPKILWFSLLIINELKLLEIIRKPILIETSQLPAIAWFLRCDYIKFASTRHDCYSNIFVLIVTNSFWYLTRITISGKYMFVNMGKERDASFASSATFQSVIFNPPPRVHGNISSIYYNSCNVSTHTHTNCICMVKLVSDPVLLAPIRKPQSWNHAASDWATPEGERNQGDILEFQWLWGSLVEEGCDIA